MLIAIGQSYIKLKATLNSKGVAEFSPELKEFVSKFFEANSKLKPSELWNGNEKFVLIPFTPKITIEEVEELEDNWL